MALSAHGWHPSPGEGSTCLGASTCSTRSSSTRGRAGSGGGHRRARPVFEACWFKTHFWKINTNAALYYVHVRACVCVGGRQREERGQRISVLIWLTLQSFNELKLGPRCLSRLFFYGALQLLQHFLMNKLHHSFNQSVRDTHQKLKLDLNKDIV